MSSMTDPRLAMIGAAIDELAEASRAASGTPGPSSIPGAPDTSGSMAERVARSWAMVADLDPGVAQRLSGYTGQNPQGRPDPRPATHD
jgi:hypothetical protein